MLNQIMLLLYIELRIGHQHQARSTQLIYMVIIISLSIYVQSTDVAVNFQPSEQN